MARERIDIAANSSEGDRQPTGLKYAFIPVEIFLHPDLNETDKQIYWIITLFDTTDRHCYATNNRIGSILGCDARTVIRSIIKLCKMGIISRQDVPVKADETERRLICSEEHLNPLLPIRTNFNENLHKPLKMLQLGGVTTLSRGGCQQRHCIQNKRIQDNGKKDISLRDMRPTGLTVLIGAIKELPDRIREVFEYWHNKGLKIPGPTTKGWDEAVRNVDGLFTSMTFRRYPEMNGAARIYTMAEIKHAIDQYALAAFDPAYRPVDKTPLQRKTLDRFVFDPFCKVREGNDAGRSNFLHYLKQGLSTNVEPVKPNEDQYPEITKALIGKYTRKVLGGMAPKLSVRDQNKFIASAEMLHEFTVRFKSRFSFPTTPSNLSDWMIDCLIEDKGGSTERISPGWFCSNETMNRRFPSYLYRMGIVTEDVQGLGWRFDHGHFNAVQHPYQHN